MTKNDFLFKISFVLFFVSGILFSQTRVLYDFNTTGQLSNYFNGVGQVGNVSESSTSGISGTGSLLVPSGSAQTVYSTKVGFSMGSVGSVYKFIAYFKSNGSSGFGGFGFTSASPANANVISSPSGNIYRPDDALGISVHGAGFVFHNGSTQYAGYWTNGDGGVNINTIKGSQLGVLDNTSPDRWYKCALEIKKVTSTTFNMKIEVWPCYVDGSTLQPDTNYAVHEVAGLSNSTIMNSPLIYSYFNLSGGRITAFDDYEVDLAGGATVVQPGAPVVLTSSATSGAGFIAVNGNVTSDNGTAVTERGFVYSQSVNPTINDNKIAIGTGTGLYNGQTPNLSNGTYYVRAFATNNVATSYGAEIQVVLGSGSLMVGESNVSHKLLVFPNPAKEFATVYGLDKGTRVGVYDASGKQVYNGVAVTNLLSISTASLQNGVYIIKAGDKTSKLIISK